MIKLIVTANDRLYERLALIVEAQGHTPARAVDVLTGLHYAMAHVVDVVFVDMTLHAADTLLEALHSRQVTRCVTLYAIQTGGRLPFELRRLCAGVLEADAL